MAGIYGPSPGGGGYAPQDQPSPYSPGGGQSISPGAITYTTSTGDDGRVIYHPFRAVPASYQTPNGVVTGIQWVPAEATQVLPNGAQPANADFAASWNRGHLTRDDEKALKSWQKDEEKRRRKEEKQSAKRTAQMERERRERDREDQEIRSARERDNYQSTSPALGRRKSFNAGTPAPTAGYPVVGGGSGGGIYAAGDLASKFGDMGVGNDPYDRKVGSNYAAAPAPARLRIYAGDNNADKRRSVYDAPTSPYASTQGSTYPDAAYPTASRDIYSNPSSAYPSSPNMRNQQTPFAGPGGGSGYPTAYGSGHQGADPIARAGSPYARAPSPYAPGGGGGGGSGGVYPRGHILEGQPIQPMQGNRSRAPSPVGGGTGHMQYPTAGPGFHQAGPGYPVAGGASPNMPHSALANAGSYQGTQPEQLPAPPGFSRPINAAQAYTAFDTLKIQEMDDFIDTIPRMPLVAQSHDVYHEDWIRLMQDLALAWTGKLPIPEFSRTGRTPKRSSLAADLVDLWNSSFFLARGLEIVLYKGRERRSGPNAGTIDRSLPTYDQDDSLSDSSSSTDLSDSDSDDSDDDKYRTGYGGADPEARRRRKERKREKKRRHKERKLRKKAKAKDNKYSIYLIYVPNGPGGGGGGIGGRMSPMPGGMGGINGRISPMPGGMGGGIGGRMSPMPNAMGLPSGMGGGISGRMSPMPGGY